MYIAVLSPAAPHPNNTLLLEYEPQVKHPNPHNMELAKVACCPPGGVSGRRWEPQSFSRIYLFFDTILNVRAVRDPPDITSC